MASWHLDNFIIDSDITPTVDVQEDHSGFQDYQYFSLVFIPWIVLIESKKNIHDTT